MAGGNSEIVRRGYDAWNRGDLGGVLDLVDPEFEWEPVEIPWSGTMRTREEFESYLRGLGRIWETFRLEPEELREIGDAVLSGGARAGAGPRLGGGGGTAPRAPSGAPRNRRARRMHTSFSTRQALEAATAPEPRGPRP